MSDQAPKKDKPDKPHRSRVNFYVDDDTFEVLDDIVGEKPEVESRSSALRFLARWYKMTAHSSEA